MEDSKHDQIVKYNKKHVDISLVNKKDIPDIERVIYGLLGFNDIMPPLQIRFQDCVDHYKMIIRGWNQPIDFLKFSNMFLNPQTRSPTYDNITYGEGTISDDDGSFVAVFRIKKTSATAAYNSGKKIK